jgi:uncharacterized protein (TIGR02145 family)
MKRPRIVSFLFIVLLNCNCLSMQDPGGSKIGPDQVIDKEGNIYKTVKIGEQVWMAENLNADHFRNGDPIGDAEDSVVWQDANQQEKSAWCYYNQDTALGRKYHKLYNWYTVNDPRGLAPAGWHIPSDSEWNVVINYLGGELKAGASMKMSTKIDTASQNNFAGIMGGYRFNFGTFADFGFKTMFWSSSETNSADSWFPMPV